jgi:O-antigen ligase
LDAQAALEEDLKDIRPGRWPLILSFTAVPISIAVSQFLLGIAVLMQIISWFRSSTNFHWPRCLWLWLVWVGFQFGVWALSPEPALGSSEIRHTLLLGALFITLPSLNRVTERRMAWQGIFLSATLSSIFLIGQFVWRFFHYRREIAAGGEVSFYVRSGGLLHHWMVYGTVEILVIAGFLSFWSIYSEERRLWWPVAAVNGLAIVLSLTRMAWVTCLLLLVIQLVWMRSKWIWALPFVPLALYLIFPTVVRVRVTNSMDLNYYSNFERLQMLRVGWQMVREHPLTGVGPGRVDKLYESYLSSGDYVPAYHGHLHNNFAQIAAQFGIPATLVLLLFTGVVFYDLVKARRSASTRDARFVSQTALLALTGFVFAGLFEYTYGHSLALMLLSFAVLPALIPSSGIES